MLQGITQYCWKTVSVFTLFFDIYPGHGIVRRVGLSVSLTSGLAHLLEIGVTYHLKYLERFDSFFVCIMPAAQAFAPQGAQCAWCRLKDDSRNLVPPLLLDLLRGSRCCCRCFWVHY